MESSQEERIVANFSSIPLWALIIKLVTQQLSQPELLFQLVKNRSAALTGHQEGFPGTPDEPHGTAWEAGTPENPQALPCLCWGELAPLHGSSPGKNTGVGGHFLF